jgi:hypothetical protein
MNTEDQAKELFNYITDHKREYGNAILYIRGTLEEAKEAGAEAKEKDIVDKLKDEYERRCEFYGNLHPKSLDVSAAIKIIETLFK